MLHATTRHRAPILWILLPFMAGLGAAHVMERPVPIVWLMASAAIAMAAALRWRRSRFMLVALVYLVGLLGAGFYQLRTARLREWEQLPPREAQLNLRIVRLFSSGAKKRQMSGIARILSGGNNSELTGQYVYFSLSPTRGRQLPQQSSEYRARGVLQPISPSAATATFDGYLINSGVYFRFTPGRFLRETRPPSAYRRFCNRTQIFFGNVLSQGLERHPELAAIIRGMLLGEVVDLTPEQKQLFIQTGTLHLFSISGLHIAAIAIALNMLLGLLRLPRLLLFGLSSATLWLYVDITGSSPSAIRAVVMVILFEAAYVMKRPVNPIATLSFAALASLLSNPMQLFSASFQMSYGIVAALLLLGLPLADWLQTRTALFANLPKATWTWRHHGLSAVQRWLSSGLGIGSSTSLVGGLCGIIYFNLFTPGALLANLLLIPISSFTLWAGFLSLLFGLAHVHGLSVLFNHSAALTLLIMEKGLRALLLVPGMFWHASFVTPAAGFLSLCLLLAVMFYGYATHWAWRFGGWIPPFAVTALVLAFAVRYG